MWLREIPDIPFFWLRHENNEASVVALPTPPITPFQLFPRSQGLSKVLYTQAFTEYFQTQYIGSRCPQDYLSSRNACRKDGLFCRCGKRERCVGNRLFRGTILQVNYPCHPSKQTTASPSLTYSDCELS